MPMTCPAPSCAPDAPLPSASIIVMREAPHANAHGDAYGASGIEVLLMERASQARNFGGALVFPGGKVEPGDDAIALQSGFTEQWPQLMPRLPQDPQTPDQQALASLYGAALRETLEEVGLLWLATCGSADTPPAPAAAFPAPANALAAARGALAQGQTWDAALNALRAAAPAATPYAPSVQALRPFSRWITPKITNMSAKRFDTWFFLASLPPGQQASADGSEAQHLLWASPRQLLTRYAQGEILLAPPQIMTLAHLCRFADSASLSAYASQQPILPIEPVSIDQEGQRIVCFPGDPLHEQTQPRTPGPTRLVLRNKRFEPEQGFEALFA
ncbi:NUDIX hydrolase [Allofranklinella schreckenbergeri]|uniref:NUDIX hydrolase n=1 Tax=Allofranklinella schreckenbergeri TaxID=1076744 RepID=A0A3M6QBX9_9BURK|nr:NUDIX hydrolase [Allofranklinella schreckenbergeri]RMX00656.1 NUDIX hydrolase [Allofranklinella schreckenbergeri]